MLLQQQQQQQHQQPQQQDGASFHGVPHSSAFLLSRRSMLLASPIGVAHFGSNAAFAIPTGTSSLNEPASIASIMSNFRCAGRHFRVKGLQTVGRGAHGTVMVEPGGNILAKVSYANTASTVEAECSTLQHLEAKEVPHV